MMCLYAVYALKPSIETIYDNVNCFVVVVDGNEQKNNTLIIYRLNI